MSEPVMARDLSTTILAWLRAAVDVLTPVERESKRFWLAEKHPSGSGFSGFSDNGPDNLFVARNLLSKLHTIPEFAVAAQVVAENVASLGVTAWENGNDQQSLVKLVEDYCFLRWDFTQLWDEETAIELTSQFSTSLLTNTQKVQVIIPLYSLSCNDSLLPLEFGEGLQLVIADRITQIRYISIFGGSLSRDSGHLPPYYCLLATEEVPVFANGVSDTVRERANRAIVTLRLLYGGQVRLHEYVIMPRLGHFVAWGIAAYSSLETTNAIGQYTHVNGSKVSEIQLTYEGLTDFSQEFPMALSRFRATGYRASSDDKVIDSSIVMENMLLPQENQELAYRFAIRAACLLSTDPKERIQLYEEAKELYNLRSSLVHGDSKKIDKIKAKTKEDWGERAVDLAARIILAVLRIRRDRPNNRWINEVSDLLPFQQDNLDVPDNE